MLNRSATGGNRDIYLLSSKEKGAEFRGALVHPWKIGAYAKGEMVLFWTEGTGWQKGGALAWQVFDAAGKPTDEKGRVERGIPVWGLPTVAATGVGFTIIH